MIHFHGAGKNHYIMIISSSQGDRGDENKCPIASWNFSDAEVDALWYGPEWLDLISRHATRRYAVLGAEDSSLRQAFIIAKNRAVDFATTRVRKNWNEFGWAWGHAHWMACRMDELDILSVKVTAPKGAQGSLHARKRGRGEPEVEVSLKLPKNVLDAYLDISRADHLEAELGAGEATTGRRGARNPFGGNVSDPAAATLKAALDPDRAAISGAMNEKMRKRVFMRAEVVLSTLGSLPHRDRKASASDAEEKAANEGKFRLLGYHRFSHVVVEEASQLSMTHMFRLLNLMDSETPLVQFSGQKSTFGLNPRSSLTLAGDHNQSGPHVMLEANGWKSPEAKRAGVARGANGVADEDGDEQCQCASCRGRRGGLFAAPAPGRTAVEDPTRATVGAESASIGDSIFEQLQVAYQGTPVSHMLQITYRLHPFMVPFPSTHFYGGQLKAAWHLRQRTSLRAVAPDMCADPMRKGNTLWLENMPVLFIPTRHPAPAQPKSSASGRGQATRAAVGANDNQIEVNKSLWNHIPPWLVEGAKYTDLLQAHAEHTARTRRTAGSTQFQNYFDSRSQFTGSRVNKLEIDLIRELLLQLQEVLANDHYNPEGMHGILERQERFFVYQDIVIFNEP